MKKNNKAFKIILILIDIIAVITLVIVTEKWIDHRNNGVPMDNSQVVKIRRFTLQIPDYIKYEEIEEPKFSFDSDKYYATIEIISNENNFVFADAGEFYQMLLEDGFNVNEYEEYELDDNKVLIFNDYNGDEDTKLCYFKLLDPYAVEIILVNKDGEYKDNLEEIYSILLSAEYDYESKEPYGYKMYLPND